MVARRGFALLALLGALAAHGVLTPTASAFPQVRTMLAHPGNYTARSSRAINLIVIHTVEGSEAGCIAWFRNPAARASAHYVVSHAGRVTRMVPDMSIAWHAGNWSYNERSIGIENEGFAGRNNWTDTQYRVLADLVRGLCDRYGIPKDRAHIIAHDDVPNQTHWDPGPHFDWTRFLNLVRGASPPPPPPPPPPSGGLTGLEVTADVLNVRTGIMATIIGQVRRGQRFVARGSSGGWYRIDFGARDGWISGQYVRRVAFGAEQVSAGVLNVRLGPSTGDRIMAQTRAGRIHARLSRAGDWFLVQLDHRRGWVHGGYTDGVSAR